MRITIPGIRDPGIEEFCISESCYRHSPSGGLVMLTFAWHASSSTSAVVKPSYGSSSLSESPNRSSLVQSSAFVIPHFLKLFLITSEVPCSMRISRLLSCCCIVYRTSFGYTSTHHNFPEGILILKWRIRYRIR